MALKLLITMARENRLCQLNAVQNVPNNILGKITNYGFPTTYR